MNIRHPILLFLWLWLPSLTASAQELDLVVRSSAAGGRILVTGRNAQLVQQLSVWADRGLTRLEGDWRVEVPFQRRIPLDLRVEDGADRIQLTQNFRGGELRQVIRIPAEDDRRNPRDLAVALVRALGTRVLLSRGMTGPGPAAERMAPWEGGAAAELISGMGRELAARAVERYGAQSPPPPELAVSGDWVDALVLYRWMQDTGLRNRDTAATFWKHIADEGPLTEEDWVALSTSAASLRELHVQWQVWWRSEIPSLIAEYELTRAARDRLESELRLVPAMYGLSVENLNRFAAVELPDLDAYLGDPKFERALVGWIYRLQRLRFRQGPEFDQEVRRHEAALNQAILAHRAKGKERERLWKEAVGMWGAPPES